YSKDFVQLICDTQVLLDLIKQDGGSPIFTMIVDGSLGATYERTSNHEENTGSLVNPSVPRTHGDTSVHVSQIDYMVEVQDREIYVKPDGWQPTEIEKTIGKLIAENLVENGATLQLGIGTIPDTTLAAMRNHKDLGIHSEAVGDGVLDLIEMGVITGLKKSVMPGK
ncbi:hypothetical protein ANCDUO_25415, partial [Ancylostoma duodenale]